MEFGESFEQCAKRECKEETNLELSNIELLQIQESIFPPEYHEKRHFIFIDMCGKALNNDIKLNHEFEEFKWFNHDEVFKLNLGIPTRKLIEKFISVKLNNKINNLK